MLVPLWNADRGIAMFNSRVASRCALMALFLSPIGFASDLVQGEVTFDKSCGYVEELTSDTILLFETNAEADATISNIVRSTGLRKNFTIAAGGVPNAAAMIQPPSTRFVVYNPSFMADVRQMTSNKWAPISILAHEIGHHLQGHTLERGGSRPNIELEADEYSGFVLQRMGASLADAKSAMERLGSEQGSATHPAKRDRLVAIARGWTDACEQVDCYSRQERTGGGRVAETEPEVEPEPERETASERRRRERREAREAQRDAGICEYANDGECDEPDLCDVGTDANDCGRRAAAPNPQQPLYCCDGFGRKWCPMAVNLPPGSSCVCPGVAGSGYVCP